MAESARKFAEQLINTVSKEFYPVNKITELIESRDADLQKPPERTYTESELAAERAALLREAAAHADKIHYAIKGMSVSETIPSVWPHCQTAMDILVIPADQSALDKLLAIERAALLREAIDTAYQRIKTGRERGIDGDTICADLLDDLKAIPTDQSALARVEAAAYERGKRDERERIHDRIVTDQATSAGDYSDAENYADEIVKE